MLPRTVPNKEPLRVGRDRGRPLNPSGWLPPRFVMYFQPGTETSALEGKLLSPSAGKNKNDGANRRDANDIRAGEKETKHTEIARTVRYAFFYFSTFTFAPPYSPWFFFPLSLYGVSSETDKCGSRKSARCLRECPFLGWVETNVEDIQEIIE